MFSPSSSLFNFQCTEPNMPCQFHEPPKTGSPVSWWDLDPQFENCCARESVLIKVRFPIMAWTLNANETASVPELPCSLLKLLPACTWHVPNSKQEEANTPSFRTPFFKTLIKATRHLIQGSNLWSGMSMQLFYCLHVYL